jgi:hypothetical protein
MLFAWLVLAVYSPPVAAQGWANKLFKDRTTHDFGTVARGAQLYHRFPITNIYAVPLDVTNVRVSCGCVTAVPSKKTLKPRETAYIDVSMDGRRFSGAKSVTVFVTVGPQFISTAELKVTANSRTDVVFNPGEVNLGAVTPGQAAAKTVDIEYAGTLDWKVLEVVDRDQPFTAELKEWYRRPGQVGYRVTVTLKPNTPPGRLRRDLLVKTNDPGMPVIPLLVEADVQAALSVSPSPLPLGTMQLGDALNRRVVVKGQKPFVVTGIDGLGDGVSLVGELSRTPAVLQVLTFKCEAKSAGPFLKQLSIRTDQKGTLPLTIEGAVTAP